MLPQPVPWAERAGLNTLEDERGLLTYSRSRGLLAGIDLDATSVSQSKDDTNGLLS